VIATLQNSFLMRRISFSLDMDVWKKIAVATNWWQISYFWYGHLRVKKWHWLTPTVILTGLSLYWSVRREIRPAQLQLCFRKWNLFSVYTCHLLTWIWKCCVMFVC